MRINARLDKHDEQKIQYIVDQTHETVTDVLREAIALYYDKVKGSGSRKSRALMDCGFVASGEGSRNLSADYKKQLKKSLEKKWSS